MVEQTFRIVLIEDNHADAYLIEEALREQGIASEITRYADGDEALRQLIPASGRLPPLPDLVLLDLHLPGTEGSEILRAIRAERHYRHVPIAVISGAPPDRLKHLDLSGSARLVHKSMDLSEYLHDVGVAVLELARPASEDVARPHVRMSRGA